MLILMLSLTRDVDNRLASHNWKVVYLWMFDSPAVKWQILGQSRKLECGQPITVQILAAKAYERAVPI